MKNFDENKFIEHFTAAFKGYKDCEKVGEEREYIGALVSFAMHMLRANPELIKELTTIAKLKLERNSGMFQA